MERQNNVRHARGVGGEDQSITRPMSSIAEACLDGLDQSLRIPAETVRQVAMRFQLGKFMLHTWKPRLALLYYSREQPLMAQVLGSNLGRALPHGVDGVIFRGLPPAHFPEGLRWTGAALNYVPRHSATHLVDLSGSFEAYLASQLSAKPRQNIKRAVRKLQALKHDAALLEIVTRPEDILRFLSEAAVVSAQTFQTRLLDVGLVDTPARRHHLQQTALAGDARGYLLKLNGEAIAFAWCRHREGQLIYDIIGYLPQYAEYSPGTVLLYLILEDLFSLKQYDALNFGVGEAHYKAMFATRKEVLADVYFLRPTIRNGLMLTLYARLLDLSISISRLLDRLGLKAVVKRMFRRWTA